MTSEHVKYVVEIKQVYRTSETVTEQFCTKETPTQVFEDDYGGKKKATFDKQYELRDVEKREVKERNVYRQEVEKLDLVGVINAVNSAHKAEAAQ